MRRVRLLALALLALPLAGCDGEDCDLADLAEGDPDCYVQPVVVTTNGVRTHVEAGRDRPVKSKVSKPKTNVKPRK